MRIVFSTAARVDLERLNEFIAIRNPKAANRIVNKLIVGIEKLLQFPDMGIKVNQFQNPDMLRDVYILDYQVRYLKLLKGIRIVRIWHQKEDR